jgi:hypothetical protein
MLLRRDGVVLEWLYTQVHVFSSSGWLRDAARHTLSRHDTNTDPVATLVLHNLWACLDEQHKQQQQLAKVRDCCGSGFQPVQ